MPPFWILRLKVPHVFIAITLFESPSLQAVVLHVGSFRNEKSLILNSDFSLAEVMTRPDDTFHRFTRQTEVWPMAKQGCFLTEPELKQMVKLLAETDMTLAEIAQRMACSRSTVAAVNRKFQVRMYAGPKSDRIRKMHP